jgi:hypothetical protein
MGYFKSTRYFPIAMKDLAPVADDLEKHFQVKEFEVHKEPILTGGWHVDISKGGIFKAVLGMKTALKIEIEPSGSGTQAKAGIGIFGSQVVPTVIMWYFLWPVLLTQIWGLVQQSRLDDEALSVLEESLKAHTGATVASSLTALSSEQKNGKFCTSCGQSVPASAKFCSTCGATVG